MKKLLFIILLAFWMPVLAQVANTSTTVLPQATYTAATVNSPTAQNFNYRGVHVVINVSSVASGTYTPHIQAQDPVSGVWYDLLVGAAISAAGTTVLKVYPGIGVVANGSASDMLPQTWRVQLIGASTPSMVLSVSSFMDL